MNTKKTLCQKDIFGLELKRLFSFAKNKIDFPDHAHVFSPLVFKSYYVISHRFLLGEVMQNFAWRGLNCFTVTAGCTVAAFKGPVQFWAQVTAGAELISLVLPVYMCICFFVPQEFLFSPKNMLRSGLAMLNYPQMWTSVWMCACSPTADSFMVYYCFPPRCS